MMTMSQAIKEAFGESGGALSKEAIKQSVESRYPGKWQPTNTHCSPLRVRHQQPEGVRSSPPLGTLSLQAR